MNLKRYKKMRKFSRTPEPPGSEEKGQGPLRFVVQFHAASRSHYDFRLEMDGVLKSWAVPKGPSLDPLERRLAVMVEDHPVAYGAFEGVIPKGNYGAGTVMIWDQGTYVSRETEDREQGEASLLKNLAKGHITFILHGKKLRGEFALIKLAKGEENAWLLVKKHDQFVSRQEITYEDRSALTGRTLGEIAKESEEHKIFWTAGGRTEPSASSAEPPSKARAKKHLKPPASLGAKKLAALLKDAPREEFPSRLKPHRPLTAKGTFDREGWIFEPAWDGYRALALAGERPSQLQSRAGVPFKGKFPEILTALDACEKDVILDGFIVAVDASGAPRRKGTLAADEHSAFVFYAIDILHWDGGNLRERPLHERKAILAQVLKPMGDAVRVNPMAEDEGRAVFAELLDGPSKAILARDGRASYDDKSRREDWLVISLHRGAGEMHGGSANTPALTNLGKLYWPKEGYTKGDLITYYREVAPVMLPYLVDRPQSLHRHPNGIEGESFFQKEMAGNLPRWAKSITVTSEHSGGSITYALCQDEATLLYLANLGCIEINPWNSRIATLENPDYVVIDLDPNEAPLKAVVEVALLVRGILEDIEAPAFCKTSGGRGLHIYVPLAPVHSYEDVRGFAELMAHLVHKRLPALTSVERMPARRRGRVYLDYLQNRRGATTAAIYAARPRPKAPVSTPLTWAEVNPNLDPTAFTIKTMPDRILKRGDLWEGFHETQADLKGCYQRLKKIFDK